MRWRILVGSGALLLGLALYVAAVVNIAARIVPDHWAAQAVYYALAGVLWVIPAARLTRWMQTGADRGRTGR